MGVKSVDQAHRPGDYLSETSPLVTTEMPGRVSTYAMATVSDQFRCFLPGSFLTRSLRRVLFKTFGSAPCVRGINLIQKLSRRSSTHKLLKPSVSTAYKGRVRV